MYLLYVINFTARNLFIAVKIEKLQRRHFEITEILSKLELWKLSSKWLLPTLTIPPSYFDVMHIDNVYYTLELHYNRHSDNWTPLK